MSLNVTTSMQEKGTITISLVGRLDGTTAEECQSAVHQVFEKESFSTLIFDLAGLEYISSAGLRVLLISQKKANAAGSEAVLEGMQAPVAEVIRLAGILEQTDILNSEESGDAYLDGIQRRERMKNFDMPD